MKWTDSKLRVAKMKKAFDVMKQKAMAHRQAKIYQKKLIVQKVTMVFKKLEGCGQQINRGRMIEAFQQWNSFVVVQRQKDMI